MKKSIRHLATDILTRVNRSDAFASLLLDDCLDANQLSGTADGKLLTYLVYGVLRNRGRLDWIIAALYRGEFENLDETVKNILRISLFQLTSSDRLPAFAVVNEAVKISNLISPQKSSLVNALLRNYLRRGNNIPFPAPENGMAKYISVNYSHPSWLVNEWLNVFGPENTQSLCASNNELPPVTLRVNTLKISRAELIAKLSADGFHLAPTRHSPDGLIIHQGIQDAVKTEAFSAGFFRLQDEGAQCIAYLVVPEENSNVLDACAGSGGKTAHLAALMKNHGRILAIDKNPATIEELKKEARRLGVTCVEAYKMDLSYGLPDKLSGRFGFVLVDAPCSGTGTLRRNPEIKWRLQPEDIPKTVRRQKKILAEAARAVKNNGKLIYCTCSLLPQENENLIKEFMAQNSEFSLCPPPADLDKSLFDGDGFYRTYPHIHNTDGFFAAALRRN
ncbi:MAG TPA: 16S rRNA (cytosine(967)-C(5))-methyltransferase RsmB [Smithellaceae bacterium]|nr:16S rRNA (cytosine(967)-C(5))-methyltransferase RsmB [Smithellaceae bacterium]HRS88695.1 16S rRNA (cytosine(967)-C(5))-methyltransferase RsmB [Smithellaceae bacterium]HRV26739.1 16S rRNA (cytosine(967)-C(5))-methyltransferase RsmB [Smithellaceae bacterium]